MYRKHPKILLRFVYFFMVISFIATGRANAASLQLTWVDNSQDEDGFHVERKLDNNGTFSLIATVGPNVESYNDGNLADSTTYCYRVNAFNSAGNSAYSNEVCGTTPIATVTTPTSTPTPAPTFDFSLTNGGDKSVTQGQSLTNTITVTLTTGLSQGVSLSTSGLLPSGTTFSFTPSTSCKPTCSLTLNIVTTDSTPAATYTIIVAGTGGGLSRTTSFTLTVNAPKSNRGNQLARGRGRR
jgi:hypothetical protein